MELDTISCSDALVYLKTLPDDSVDCCVSSIPYYGLRDYGADGQIGLESTPQEFIAKIVEVYEAVRRVLKLTGTCWLNVGDTRTSTPKGNKDESSSGLNGAKKNGEYSRRLLTKDNRLQRSGFKEKDKMMIPARIAIALCDAGWYLRSEIVWAKPATMPSSAEDRPTDAHEMVYMLTKRPKYWSDFTAIREKARDWGTRKRETGKWQAEDLPIKGHKHTGLKNGNQAETGRNTRDVWTINPEPSRYRYCEHCDRLFVGPRLRDILYRKVGEGDEAKEIAFCPGCNQSDGWVDHFAAFPSKLVERCILAGCPTQVCAECGKPWERVVEKKFTPQMDVSLERGMKDAVGLKPMDKSNGWHKFPRGSTSVSTVGWRPTCKCKAGVDAGIVLDPFMGSGTTALVARRLGRHFLGCDLSQKYVNLCNARLGEAFTLPLFADL